MRGICFIESLFEMTVAGSKNMTRRLHNQYKVGEILYLKEPYFIDEVDALHYKFSEDGKENGVNWKNKLFMPASAARYFIRITAKRQECLQDISKEDCIKEGIEKVSFGFMNGIDMNLYTSFKDCFAALIDKISGKGTWESNPEVTVYEYELLGKRPPIELATAAYNRWAKEEKMIVKK
ncbi:MAG: hypothetical protein LBV74_01210 [Tannerella sp.]|jgi:hypothetical protein|nr:hypothetical protein [Tannerella sp.]